MCLMLLHLRLCHYKSPHMGGKPNPLIHGLCPLAAPTMTVMVGGRKFWVLTPFASAPIDVVKEL